MPTDADLLARFVADRDAGAFELLVWRHAALVLRVGRGILRDRHAPQGDDWVPPADVEKSVLAAIADLKLPKRKVVAFLIRIDLSVDRDAGARRFERIKEHTRRWAEACGLKWGWINIDGSEGQPG